MGRAIEGDLGSSVDADEQHVSFVVDLLRRFLLRVPCEQGRVEVLTGRAPERSASMAAGQVDHGTPLRHGVERPRWKRQLFEFCVGRDLLDQRKEAALLQSDVTFEQLAEPTKLASLD